MIGTDIAALVVGRLTHHGISIQYLTSDRSADCGLCARGSRRGGGGGARRAWPSLPATTAGPRPAAAPPRRQKHAALGWPRGRQAGLADRQHPAQGRFWGGGPVLHRRSRGLGGG